MPSRDAADTIRAARAGIRDDRADFAQAACVSCALPGRRDWRVSMTVRCGLRGRAIGLCILLLLGTAAAISVSLLWQGYGHDIGQMREYAVVYAQTIGRLAEPAILLNDRAALTNVAQAAAAYPAVCQVTIVDATGQALATFERYTHQETEAEMDPRPALGHLSGSRGSNVERTKTHLAVAVPILRTRPDLELGLLDESETTPTSDGAPLGAVHLTYSLAEIQNELNSRMLSSVLLAGSVLAVGTAVMLLAVRSLLRPLRDLVLATAAIAQGDRTKRASENAVGEIGELARSFNHMADCLQESYNSIEQKVAQRTAELEARQHQLETEIAERRRAEETLCERERRFSDIAENAKEWIWEIDATGKYTYASPIVKEILGYEPEDLIGTYYYDPGLFIDLLRVA
ncbi:MAG: HAMP domain-containing protein [Planctomycetes bacterium]|nr:HAMP domain-containing protein [Planctomycetota bacterium]